ncbi:hypothetical protein BsWGS_16204 [Bradybaena similaris]
MARHVIVCFKVLIAFVAATGIIIFSTMRTISSWSVPSMISDTRLSPITVQQLAEQWRLPRGSISLLPLTNSVIDVYVDLKKFREQVKQQNKECRGLKEDPFTMFTSQPSNTTTFTAEMDIKRIERAFTCGGALYLEYLTAPPREDLYPFEAFYLSDPPLWSESTVACHKHSTISLHGSNTTFIVGDAVTLVIKMVDTKGRPRLKGGDRIKVWLKDVKSGHSISTKITDFNNGTYLATTVLPWAGTVRVMATLRQPREFFRALAYVHRALKSTLPFFGAYKNAKASEGVACSPIPLVPGYRKSDLCDLTLENGSPWYCGRPSKLELNCSDYHYIRFSRTPISMPVTPVEDKLLKQNTNQNNFLPGKILLTVEPMKSGMTRLQDPIVPCNKVSARATWRQPVPSGYFYHNQWKSFLCSTPDQPEKVAESCLKNVHMIFYGDSNARYFYYRVTSKTKCNETVFGEECDKYHAPKTCENKTSNFSVQHISHPNPFHVGLGRFLSTANLRSPEELFGSIPSEGRYIIFFCHYLHFTAHHISVYERALAALRDAILRLLQRNPHVILMLRGPHVAERSPYIYYMGDVWAQYLITIQEETFRDLQDRIIYFPTWDITEASEDTTIHPNCNNHLSDVMFQFMCGRDQ